MSIIWRQKLKKIGIKRLVPWGKHSTSPCWETHCMLYVKLDTVGVHSVVQTLQDSISMSSLCVPVHVAEVVPSEEDRLYV